MAAKRHYSSKMKYDAKDGKVRRISRMQSDPMPDSVHERYHMSSHEMYAGPNISKRMMSRDGALIYEDRNATALLPTEVIDRDWPKARGYALNNSRVGDLFSESLRQMSKDQESLSREKDFNKY